MLSKLGKFASDFFNVAAKSPDGAKYQISFWTGRHMHGSCSGARHMTTASCYGFKRVPSNVTIPTLRFFEKNQRIPTMISVRNSVGARAAVAMLVVKLLVLLIARALP